MSKFDPIRAIRQRPVQHIVFIIVFILALAAVNVAFSWYVYNENYPLIINALGAVIASFMVISPAVAIAEILDIGHVEDAVPSESTIESKEYDAVKQAIDNSDDEEEDLIQ